MNETKCARSVLITKAPTKEGRLDAYLILPGIEEQGEALDIETRVIHGPVRKVFEFIGSTPYQTQVIIGKHSYEIIPGQEKKQLFNEFLEGNNVELWIVSTRKELRALLLTLPSMSDGYDPTR